MKKKHKKRKQQQNNSVFVNVDVLVDTRLLLDGRRFESGRRYLSVKRATQSFIRINTQIRIVRLERIKRWNEGGWGWGRADVEQHVPRDGEGRHHERGNGRRVPRFFPVPFPPSAMLPMSRGAPFEEAEFEANGNRPSKSSRDDRDRPVANQRSCYAFLTWADETAVLLSVGPLVSLFYSFFFSGLI